MEIKINKEIRSYKETVYFGLTARQLICSLLAVGTAVGLYFALRGVLDRETLGWLCIVGAAPMAAAGFFHYNGLTLEQFLVGMVQDQFPAGRSAAVAQRELPIRPLGEGGQEVRKLFKGRSTERDAFRIPRSVQQSIPIKRIYKDGIFQVSGRFSKTWRFFDVNYAVASPEKQMELFLGYCGVLNSLPIDAGIKLTLVNRQLNRQEFSRNLLMALPAGWPRLYAPRVQRHSAG